MTGMVAYVLSAHICVLFMYIYMQSWVLWAQDQIAKSTVYILLIMINTMRLSRTAEVVNLVENLFSCHRTEQIFWKEEAQEKKQFYRFYSFLRKKCEISLGSESTGHRKNK